MLEVVEQDERPHDQEPTDDTCGDANVCIRCAERDGVGPEDEREGRQEREPATRAIFLRERARRVDQLFFTSCGGGIHEVVV